MVKKRTQKGFPCPEKINIENKNLIEKLRSERNLLTPESLNLVNK